MMLGSPLPIANLGKRANPANGYRLWERPEGDRELEKPQGYSNSENNPEAKVV